MYGAEREQEEGRGEGGDGEWGRETGRVLWQCVSTET